MEEKQELKEQENQNKSFGQIVQKIGKTTYTVNLYFSETSKETFQDKVLRLVKNDIDFGNK